MEMNGEPHVLVVAGSDSSGGAGIVRDIETIAAHGLRACVAVTAVTVQTHREAGAVEIMPPSLVAAQMRAALAANDVRAVKIGMLGMARMVSEIASVLRARPDLPVVLDPVLVTSSGGRLLDEDGTAALKQELLPLCRLVTPNWLELAVLAGRPAARGPGQAIEQAGQLLANGRGAVLVKAGHAPLERAGDMLVFRDRPPVHFDAPRLDAAMRGSGCMLSSAVAANLAGGFTLEDAVRAAKARVFAALWENVRPTSTAPGS
ncbi:hydroxymethylpyrimidine/phosphomethylpyrimidine kinase [Aquamicrobium sp. LC103]|nr:hydroxymethylpyrimidine/phosphomethylpyrimidine kinase [Aquamicrobium sp. LC103]